MIHGVMFNNPIPSIGYAWNASAMGKLSLPVEPASLVYSHFKHISGVPAPEGSQGVAISKLNILDVLIEQVAQIKKANADAASAMVPADKLDTVIEAFNTQLRKAMEVWDAKPYAPIPLVQAGAIVNLMI